MSFIRKPSSTKTTEEDESVLRRLEKKFRHVLRLMETLKKKKDHTEVFLLINSKLPLFDFTGKLSLRVIRSL